MNRYVVLRELHGEHLPMGIAVERDSDVTIIALDEFGLPKSAREPYRVLQRDLSTVQYDPGDEGYFDQVLIELQRVASISRVETLDAVDRDTLIGLYNEKVVKPRVAAPRPYEVGRRQDEFVDARWEPTDVHDEGCSEEDVSDLRVAA